MVQESSLGRWGVGVDGGWWMRSWWNLPPGSEVGEVGVGGRQLDRKFPGEEVWDGIFVSFLRFT